MVNTLWRANVPQLYVETDREKAKSLGVPIDELYNTLAATLGSYYVNDFNKYGRTWQVLMSAEARYRRPARRHRQRLGALGQRHDDSALLARADALLVGTGHARPLQQPAGGEDLRLRRAGLQLGPGDRSAWRRSRARRCPPISASTGAAPRSRRSARAARRRIALGLAVVMVFLILAAQYERWALPLSVLLALPFGTFGALLAVWLRGLHERRLFPDRPRDAARPRREERDPDRRIRRAQEERRAFDFRRGARSRAAALPADPDDFARVHPRRRAARVLERRGRRRAPLGRAPASWAACWRRRSSRSSSFRSSTGRSSTGG